MGSELIVAAILQALIRGPQIIAALQSGDMTPEEAEAAWDTAILNWWDHNCWGQAVPTRTNITAGPHAVDSDPGLNSPATEDFTLSSSGSTAIDAALRMTINELGVQVDCKYNIGVDQDDVAAGGSGGGIVVGGGVVR